MKLPEVLDEPNFGSEGTVVVEVVDHLKSLSANVPFIQLLGDAVMPGSLVAMCWRGALITPQREH